ncbi:MAG: exodeoxyribonuclease V subunit gamma, partial [Aeromonas sp.]
PSDSILLDIDGGWRLAPLAPAQARAYLAALMAAWQQGMQRPLPLWPKTAWAWVKELTKHRPEQWQEPAVREAADKKAQQVFAGGYQQIGESDDLYVRRCFPQLNEELLLQLGALAEQHLLPIYQHLEELT